MPDTTKRTPVWAELLQLVPVVSLALPFILRGAVDLGRARVGFLVAACLTLPITVVLRKRGLILNPILLGTALWLWLGAIAFNVPVEPLARLMVETQAFGLFVAALLVGLLTTFQSPYGYVACQSHDSRWVRRSSLALLALTVALVVWAWVFRKDVRMGGGLPFIVLNVARRALGRRAP